MNYPKAQPIDVATPIKRNYVSVPQYKNHEITIGPEPVGFGEGLSPAGMHAAIGVAVGALIAGALAYGIYQHLKNRR